MGQGLSVGAAPCLSEGAAAMVPVEFDDGEPAIAAAGRSEIVVVIDDEDRENEGIAPPAHTLLRVGDHLRLRVPAPSRRVVAHGCGTISANQCSGGVMSGLGLSRTSDPVSPSVATGVAISVGASDAKALIQWMQEVLGFTLVALYEDLEDGHVRASRLEIGNHAVHVSQRVPSEIASRNVGLGVIAADRSAVDALYARALSAGAIVVTEPGRAMTGSYRFSLRDPEGDVWGVSTTWHDKPESLDLPERVI